MPGRRASSVERSESGSYLSRWSRENTPVDSTGTFSRTVQRSFTPVREYSRRSSVQLEVRVGRKITLFNRVYPFQNSDRDYHRSAVPLRTMTPVGQFTAPYRTNVNYYQEQQPLRKYDVFQLRTWSYPIWKCAPRRLRHCLALLVCCLL